MICLAYTFRLWYYYSCASLNSLTLLLPSSINESELFVTDQATFGIINSPPKVFFLDAMDLTSVRIFFSCKKLLVYYAIDLLGMIIGTKISMELPFMGFL